MLPVSSQTVRDQLHNLACNPGGAIRQAGRIEIGQQLRARLRNRTSPSISQVESAWRAGSGAIDREHDSVRARQVSQRHDAQPIGSREEACEKLDVVPPRLKVIRTMRPKCACHEGEGSGDEEKLAVRIASMPPALRSNCFS